MTRIRYDAVVATFIALLAVGVSAYTAYIQRQQVRAQVWPVLEFGTSNEPALQVVIANKGVGPALIRNVLVTADGKPATTWREVMENLLGPGQYGFNVSSIADKVLSAGETKVAFAPREVGRAEDLRVGPEGSLGARFNDARFRIGVEICYCSTLDDCWTLIQRPQETPSVVETRRCPERSATSFKQ